MIELEQERVPEKLVANNINRKNNQMKLRLDISISHENAFEKTGFHPSSWNLIYIENKFVTTIFSTADKLFY